MYRSYKNYPEVIQINNNLSKVQNPGYFISPVGSGDNRASTQSSFTHVTTNTWAHSQVFGFFRKKFRRKKMSPPAKSHFENTMGNPFFHFFKY